MFRAHMGERCSGAAPRNPTRWCPELSRWRHTQPPQRASRHRQGQAEYQTLSAADDADFRLLHLHEKSARCNATGCGRFSTNIDAAAKSWERHTDDLEGFDWPLDGRHYRTERKATRASLSGAATRIQSRPNPHRAPSRRAGTDGLIGGMFVLDPSQKHPGIDDPRN